MEINFIVKGSTTPEYVVTFINEGEGLYIFCSCQAGQNGSHCKHRSNILSGKYSDILSDNIDHLKLVEKWISDSELPNVLEEISLKTKEIQRQQKSLKDLKKKLSRLMHQGK